MLSSLVAIALAKPTERRPGVLGLGQPPEHGPDGPPDDNAVRASVGVSLSGSSIVVHVKPEWQWALHRPDNSAEVELALSLMVGACDRFGIAVERDELRAEANSAAGSTDYRFRHALVAVRAIDTLRGLQLAGSAPYLSRSATALVKCGSAWETRDRSLGPIIEGKAQCIEFLTGHNAAALRKLIAALQPFNRKALVEASLKAMQGALAELRNWENTAPALRAIHGEAQDLRNSLEAVGRRS